MHVLSMYPKVGCGGGGGGKFFVWSTETSFPMLMLGVEDPMGEWVPLSYQERLFFIQAAVRHAFSMPKKAGDFCMQVTIHCLKLLSIEKMSAQAAQSESFHTDK